MQRNYWFIGINLAMIGGQVLIIYVGGAAFSVREITGVQWGVCIALALGSLPWAVVIRFIPDKAVTTATQFIVKPIGRVVSTIGRAFMRLTRKCKDHGKQSTDEEQPESVPQFL
jgi:Ca2+-transporting ATPase